MRRRGNMDGFDLQGWPCKAEDPLLPFRRYTEEPPPNCWAFAKNFVPRSPREPLLLEPRACKES